MHTLPMSLTYTALTARATFRNGRFLMFTLALPLVLYIVFTGRYGQNGDTTGGIPIGAYLMVSMAGYGAIGAAVNAGARVAVERQTGWNRQLRLTALTPRAYVASKAAVAMMVSLPAILIVFLAGRIVGSVSLPASTWMTTGLTVWLAVIPFAALGLAIGFLGTADSVQSLTMLVFLGMAILGGLWFPIEALSPFLQDIGRLLPSYWMAQTGRDVLSGAAVPTSGLVVLAGWTAAMAALALFSYRRGGRRG